MKRIISMITLGSLFLALNVAAKHDILPTETQGSVTFISGGVGKQEQDFLASVRYQYNLHLLFAAKGSGAYVAGARVRIENSEGTAVLDTYSNGPKMFIKLQPGSYRVTAESDEHAITQRVTVTSRSGADVVYAFPLTPTD